MLNRKLGEYTDISSKYVKVGVRYCVFCCFCCLFFDFLVTSSSFFSYLFLCAHFLVCHRSLDPPFHFRGGVSTLESLVPSPKLTFKKKNKKTFLNFAKTLTNTSSYLHTYKHTHTHTHTHSLIILIQFMT